MTSEELIPPGLPEPFAGALRLAMDFVFSRTDKPLSVTLSGSVALGHGDFNSDLDIWVVVDADHRQRVQRRFNGVPCEMFFNPEARIPRYFTEEASEGRCPSVGLTLDGHVLYDPQGVAERLREQARLVRADGPQVSPETIELRRYLAVDTLDNAVDVQARDPLMASILSASAVHESLRLAYLLNGQWTPRDKDLHVEIDSVCPQAVEPLRLYRLNPTPDTARTVLQSILGVSTFFEWESSRDPV
ncbi:MAG: hypothetical protein ABFR53_01320 [Actinomycetota bacterium]